MKPKFTYVFFILFYQLVFNINYAYPNISSTKHTIPFLFENNLIIVKVKLNNFLNVNFIVDSGAEQTIITKREIAEVLNLKFSNTQSFYSADLTTVMYASLAKNLNFKFGQFVLKNQYVFVLEEDYFNLEAITGMPIHGILSLGHFKTWLTKIDYKRKNIELLPFTKKQLTTKNFDKLPCSVKQNRFYLNGQIEYQSLDTANVKLLVDTGSAHTLVLHNYSHPKIDLPENYVKGVIGLSLGGMVEGYIGKTKLLNIKDLKFEQLLTHYQVLPHIKDLSILDGRHGFIGNLLLKNYTIIFDYETPSIYLKRNKTKLKINDYDKSGLVLFVSGKNLNHFIVKSVVENSPADKAGILANDRLLSINNKPTQLFSLSRINKILASKAGKKVKLTLRRGATRYKKKIKLKDLI